MGVAFGAAAAGFPAATFEAAVVLAVGIGLQNFPEGIAVAMPLRAAGLSRGRSFWYGQLSGVVEPLAGVLGAAAVLAMRPLLPYALAFAAGAMIYVVVEELIPSKLGYGEVQQVLRNLLVEGVPIRNMPVILEALADGVARTKDPAALSEIVRGRLGRVLCELHADKAGTVHAVTLEPGIEARLAAAVGASKDPEAAPVSPAYLQKLVERIAQSVAAASKSGKEAVVLAFEEYERLSKVPSFGELLDAFPGVPEDIAERRRKPASALREGDF